MKHFKTKASLIALGVFALFALLQQLNLNPLYPDGAFFWCAFVSVFVLILASDRIGRVVMARGRDAADVAIATVFGWHRLDRFDVVTDEVPAP